MRSIAVLVSLHFLLTCCSPVSKGRLTKTLRETETRFKDQTGLVVFDLKKDKTIFQYNEDRYFTPASNTKVLTLLAALEIIGDSIPGIRYEETSETVHVWGTGDPSFLNPLCFSNDRVYRFLSERRKPLTLSFANMHTTHFGPGWAWDDYNDDYSQERSSLPVYGNSFQVLPLPDKVLVVPDFFEKYMKFGEPRNRFEVVRAPDANTFTVHPDKNQRFREILVPFRTGHELAGELLADTLKLPVTIANTTLPRSAKTLFSVPADSLFKVMMQQSDNFIAEQLLMICSAILTDSLGPEPAIQWMQRNKFQTYPDRVVWRDGSGLSRYNLVTPRTLIKVWQEIGSKVPAERLYPLLATGGKDGTLRKWYNAEKPYLYGKTGTLSNNHCLSGFLETKKGNTLIFVFMNSNYVAPLNEVRQNMQRILNLYYENY